MQHSSSRTGEDKAGKEGGRVADAGRLAGGDEGKVTNMWRDGRAGEHKGRTIVQAKTIATLPC